MANLLGKGNTTTGKIDGTHQILFIDRLGLGKKPVNKRALILLKKMNIPTKN